MTCSDGEDVMSLFPTNLNGDKGINTYNDWCFWHRNGFRIFFFVTRTLTNVYIFRAIFCFCFCTDSNYLKTYYSSNQIFDQFKHCATFGCYLVSTDFGIVFKCEYEELSVSVKGMTMENFKYDYECDKLSVSVSSCNEYDSVVLGDSSFKTPHVCSDKFWEFFAKCHLRTSDKNWVWWQV
jgi:hypothetical protein